jgi:ABC-type sugar transport system substrate-binding protein
MMIIVVFAAASLVTTATSATKHKTIYFIFTGYDYPYFSPMANAVKKAAKQYSDLTIKIVPSSNSATQEISAIKSAQAAGADGIILNPVQESVTTAAKQATQAGIPIVTVDRDVSDPSARFVFIGDSDKKLGQKEARYGIKHLKKEHLSKPWHIVILQGTQGSSTAIDRLKGSMKVLKPLVKKGKAKIILNQSADFATHKAQTIISTELSKTSNIQLIVSGNDAMALGAINALKSHNIKPGKKTFVVGADAQPDSLDAIKKGSQLATVTHSPYMEAFWAVEAMENYLNHKTKPPKNKFTNGKVFIPMSLVTKSNVNKFSKWGTPQKVPSLPYGHSKSHKVNKSK